MPDRIDWTKDLRAHLAGLRLDAAREGEIVEELSQHLDDRSEELRAGGASEAEARRLALGELHEPGEFARRMQRLSQAHVPPPAPLGQPGAGVLDGLWHDLRYAARTLRQHPGFAATIVLTLGVGIAVNTTVFTLVNAAVLRPMPFVDHDRVVRLGIVNTSTGSVAGLSYAEFQDWQAATATFEQIGASADRGVSLSGDDRPAVSAAGAYVSWNTFPLLGVQPAAGRVFTEAEDRVGAPPVVVLGDEIWRTRYGADPSVVGRTVRVAGVPSTVIGVMPAGFGFPDNERLWLPLAALPDAERTSRSARFLDVYGRLRPDVTIQQATAELAGIAAALADRHPETNRGFGPRVTSLGIAPAMVATLTLLLGAVGSVLLIACPNRPSGNRPRRAARRLARPLPKSLPSMRAVPAAA
jgi:putative ABC transport system permease protein